MIREALITCDDPVRARQLHSYWDTTRTVMLRESPATQGAIRVRFASNDRVSKQTTVVVPIAKDDLDVGHAEVPAGLHVTAWKR